MTVIDDLYDLDKRWQVTPEWHVTLESGHILDVHITDTVTHKERNRYDDGRLNYSFEVIGYEVDNRYPSEFGFLYYTQSDGEPQCLLWEFPDSNPENRTEVKWGTITDITPCADKEVDN